jgi:hypothetical protein
MAVLSPREWEKFASIMTGGSSFVDTIGVP